MTKLLEEAIAKVRDLSDDGQDEAAEILLSVAAKKRGRVVLDDETRAAVRRGVDQARRGEFVSDAEWPCSSNATAYEDSLHAAGASRPRSDLHLPR